MIVCSCNIFSDNDVRGAVRASEDLSCNAKQVYGCLGCSAECGRCARTIKTIIDLALDLYAEHDNVVKTFPPDRTDRPFTIPVLPLRSRRGWPIPNAHRSKAADEDVSVDGVAVTNDVLRRYFPTIGLGELVRNPFSRWVRSHSRPQDSAAIVLQNQQPVEQSE
jgi:bacterioferritin-associated ferredoxin